MRRPPARPYCHGRCPELRCPEIKLTTPVRSPARPASFRSRVTSPTKLHSATNFQACLLMYDRRGFFGEVDCSLQGSCRSGKTGKSQRIWVVRERSGENVFFFKSQGKWKIVATRCQIFRLKYIRFDFCWRSSPDPAGGAYSAFPDP